MKQSLIELHVWTKLNQWMKATQSTIWLKLMLSIYYNKTKYQTSKIDVHVDKN